MTEEQRALLTLHLVPGIGPRLMAALVERFGSAARALNAKYDELLQVPYLGEKVASELLKALAKLEVDSEIESAKRHGCDILFRGQAGFPAWLEPLPGSPQILYQRGSLRADDERAVAIVGSRKCTTYGRKAASQIATGLARRGYTIISGLARGIDGVAHTAALDAGGRTIAVLAGGLSSIYPPEHADLAGRAAENGALLTEATMAMEPLAGMFPARNRIISGLARGVVLVEAAEKSGALITAQHAAEQGKTVFAVPGPIDSAASGGTNRLIREGATLVRGVEDILEALEGSLFQSPSISAAPQRPQMEADQQRLWDLMEEGPTSADTLVQKLEMSVSQLTSLLFGMEMKKLIRRLPGNKYERI